MTNISENLIFEEGDDTIIYLGNEKAVCSTSLTKLDLSEMQFILYAEYRKLYFELYRCNFCKHFGLLFLSNYVQLPCVF